MGYYTDYEIEASGFKDKTEAEFFEFKLGKDVGYTLESGSNGIASDNTWTFSAKINEAKWYDWETNMKKISKEFPHITIDVTGVGEEQGDMWKARFRNGEFERVVAEFKMPDFTELV